MAFKKIVRQCLPSNTPVVHLDDLTVEERLHRIKNNVKHMLKSGNLSKFSQTQKEIESLREIILDDIIETKAEDLLLYTNRSNFKVTAMRNERSSSLTDLDKLVFVENYQLAPRRAFSIPDNLQYSGSVKEKKHKRVFKRVWSSVKKFFGVKKSKSPKHAGFSSIIHKIHSLNYPASNVYDIDISEDYDDQELNLELAYDINDIDDLLVRYHDIETTQNYVSGDIMSCGDASIYFNETQKLEDEQYCQYDYTDLTESKAYDIAYGVQKVGIVL